jgi:ribosomal protein S18 acetylase RimI-like enzyme
MGYYPADVHKTAFENSHTVVFVFQSDQLIGFGRAVSDGAYQAAIYDIAVLPEYQGRGIGRMILNKLLEKISAFNIILYSSPGKESFYEQFGFLKLKTGMALFKKQDEMTSKGFTQ